MNCRELESFLEPFLDGEFELTERSVVERHLEGCEACTRRVAAQSRMRESLRTRLQLASGSSAVRAPDSLRARVRGDLDREHRRRLRRPMVQGAAAAALALTVLGGTVLLQRHFERLALMEDATLRHARGLPFEIQGDSPEQVEAWFVGKLDHRVQVPRLSRLQLAGARLSNVKDRPAAHLTYFPNGKSGGARRVGLFVYDDSGGRVPAAGIDQPELGKLRGYNTATWREGEIVYQLVTDLDEQDILQMLEEQRGRPMQPGRGVGSPGGSGGPGMLAPGTTVRPASLAQ